jgi:hypothetical protein
LRYGGVLRIQDSFLPSIIGVWKAIPPFLSANLRERGWRATSSGHPAEDRDAFRSAYRRGYALIE